MRVVVDTHVFLRMIIPREHKVYSALIERCDIVVVNRKMENEYTGRAQSHGYRTLDIYIALRELKEKEKLSWIGTSACEMVRVNNREVKKDAHIVQLASAARAKCILTEDWTHLLNYKDKIKKEYDIEVLTPNQYLDGS